jgi:hypothetical protein
VNTVLKAVIEIFVITYISRHPYLPTDIGSLLCFIYNMQKLTHKLKPINAVGNPNQSSKEKLILPPPPQCHAGI